MTCIWCLNSEPHVSFKKVAHIFPQSLGGKRTCKNVCDDCNLYFGAKQSKLPSVELALKEPLNISRTYLLHQAEKKNLSKFKSEYFDFNPKTYLLRPKYQYRLISDFQLLFVKQFKRGIYKIFLEERNESVGDAFETKFNFIRHFARYGIGDLPVFYCKPSIPVIACSDEDIQNPVIRFTESSAEIMNQFGFYSYYFISHLLTFPTINNYILTLNNYFRYLLDPDKKICSKVIPIKYVNDLDFTFSFVHTH